MIFKKIIKTVISWLQRVRSKFSVKRILEKFYFIKNAKKYTEFYDQQFIHMSELGKEFENYEHNNFTADTSQKVKNIALFLPQFHQIPENDKWWGKNYTEWNSLLRGFPQYKGHYQPHLPHDMGFYNLLNEEALKFQCDIAKNYGIYGFCFYFYWFNGRRILEKPFDFFINSEINMPFCFFYANDSWTRTWHGFSQDGKNNDQEILLEQNHNDKDDLNLINYLITVFKDQRYIKINNKPVFIVYHTYLYADFKKTADLWRNEVKKNGFDDLLLLNVMMPDQQSKDPSDIGTDAMVQFSPVSCLQETVAVETLNRSFQGQVLDYEKLAASEKKRKFEFPVFRAAFPSWDNEARRPGKGISYKGSTPDMFYEYFKAMYEYAQKNPVDQESLLFLNAWNEWAEGAHLEPDKKYGYAYLNRIAKVIREKNGQ
jgi:hypothetical protein